MEAPHVGPDWVDHAKLAVAALAGGILRLLFRPAASILHTLWLLFGCVTCGYYGTPVVLAWWNIDQSYSGAVGALIGFVGLSVAEGILKGVDNFNIGNVLRFFLKQEGK